MTFEAWWDRMFVRYEKLPQPWWAVFLAYEALLIGAWLSEYMLLRRIRKTTGDPAGCARMDRRFIPVWVLVLLLLQLPLFRAARWSSYIPREWGWVIGGITVATAGIALRIHSIRCLQENFSYVVHVGSGHRLVTTGIYSRIRHPAYLGLLIFFIGLGGVIIDSRTIFILLTITVPLVLIRIRREERWLKEQFGDAFERWKAKTKRLVPFLL